MLSDTRYGDSTTELSTYFTLSSRTPALYKICSASSNLNPHNRRHKLETSASSSADPACILQLIGIPFNFARNSRDRFQPPLENAGIDSFAESAIIANHVILSYLALPHFMGGVWGRDYMKPDNKKKPGGGGGGGTGGGDDGKVFCAYALTELSHDNTCCTFLLRIPHTCCMYVGYSTL